ncbi:MAG: tRNA pseudouridine(38-40) synthase TruA [Myxococcota bacterium]
MTRRTLLLHVQFDGTDFAGWQMQSVHRTVQGVLTHAVETMSGHPVTLYGASRTDAGVHAKALPVSFDTDCQIPAFGFSRGLNTLLPDDVAVISVEEAEPGFRTRLAAVAKTYRYLFQVGEARRPLQNRQAAWVKRESIDVAAMAEGARRFLGDHDFAAFRAAHCDSLTTVRRMYSAEVSELPDTPLVAFELTGNAFMRHMVRIMAGTLLEVGRGRFSPDDVTRALESGDRTHAGPTGPAHGLTLLKVHFDGYPRIGGPPPG